MSTTEDLKKSKPEGSKSSGKKAIESAVEIKGGGITSAAQAKKYMEAIGVQPLAVFRGETVKQLICTSDGQFFYEVGSAQNHIRKYKHVKRDYFVIKL